MRTTRVLDKLFELAKGQDGYFTTNQAAECQVDAAAISKAATRGRIQNVSRGVYRVSAFPQSPGRAHLWEAVLWPQAASNVLGVLSHSTALSVHGLAEPNPQLVQATVPKSFRIRREVPAWMLLHRADLGPDDIVTVDGLPVTSLQRTLLDVASVLNTQTYEAILREVKRRGHDVPVTDGERPSRSKGSGVKRDVRGNEHPSILQASQIPPHLTNVPELDITGELLAPRIPEPWFTLAVWTRRKRTANLEIASERQTLLIDRDQFAQLYEELSYTGNVLSQLGSPGGVVLYRRDGKSYKYDPFHTFHFRSSEATGEPVGFVRETSKALTLALNPDLILFLGLEEQTKGTGVWIDPRTGTEVIVQSERDDINEIRIRTPELRKYLRARQKCLLVGQFQRRLYFNPSSETVEKFEARDEVIGSPGSSAKALVLSSESGGRMLGIDPFIRRELHLWYQIEPPELDVEHAFDDEPPFDLHAFTLPTSDGPVAPARFLTGGVDHNRPFDGVEGDFMDSVFFRQEVLTKYEGADGFAVDDDGSVTCGHYWGLNRSTYRLGNDLLRTSIGDFAQGVPFEEWPHWKLYAVEPPSHESSVRYRDEPTIADSVNRLAESLAQFNHGFEFFANVLGVSPKEQLWSGSLDSLAGRQLKWYYPHNASDDEFLKRAVLLSTFVSEELSTDVLRSVARVFAPDLHRGDDGKPLGSRRLLERLALIAKIATTTRTAGQALVEMLMQAEGAVGDDGELLSELRELRKAVRKDFAPIAFLYDLRNSSGVAHSGSLTAARQAAINLGLPADRWGRSEYLSLLRNASHAIDSITGAFRMSAVTLANLDPLGNNTTRAQRA